MRRSGASDWVEFRRLVHESLELIGCYWGPIHPKSVASYAPRRLACCQIAFGTCHQGRGSYRRRDLQTDAEHQLRHIDPSSFLRKADGTVPAARTAWRSMGLRC